MTTMLPVGFPGVTVSPAFGWYGQALLALVVVFLLGVAIALERDKISPAWRRVLYAATVEQLVIAYGSIQARHSNVELADRVALLSLTLTVLGLAVAILLLERRRRPVSYYRRPADRAGQH